MKKALGFMIALILSMNLTAVCQAEIIPISGKPLIGIAWCSDTDSEFFTNVCEAVEEADGNWIMLDQVPSADLKYNGEGKLTEGVTTLGALDEAAAKPVRLNTWRDSNAADAIKSVSLVLFIGGEDISPSLFYSPEPWHGIADEIDFSAERDVSDYLTMAYCLDHDISVMGFCRGMQMMSVVSGTTIIQDLPAYFAELGLE